MLLKQRLLDTSAARASDQEFKEAYQTHIVDPKELIKVLRDRLFGCRSEQTVESNTPQLALFNEPESEPRPSVGDADEAIVAPASRGGKRKPLLADLPICRVSKLFINCPNTD